MASLLMLALFGAWGNAQASVSVILYDTDGNALACDADHLKLNDTELRVENASCFANVTDNASAKGKVISFDDGKGGEEVNIRTCGYDKAKMFSKGTVYISVDCGIADNGVTARADEIQDEDEDGDGLNNWYELMVGTDPLDPDTDGNGVLDKAEDADDDGLTNLEEYDQDSNPLKADTDEDGIPDLYDIDPLMAANDGCGSIEDNIILSDRVFADEDTCEARGSIMTGKDVSVGDVGSDVGVGVSFFAGESIRLFPGFRVLGGSSFSAQIDPSLKP